jgi:hypothetical protein
MRFEESCFWTLSIVQCFFFKDKVSEAGSASVLPPPFFSLKTEAEPASETLFLKKKQWMMDKVQKQDSSKYTHSHVYK